MLTLCKDGGRQEETGITYASKSLNTERHTAETSS